MRWADLKNVAEIIYSLHQERGIKDFTFYDDALLIQAEKRLLPFLENILSGGLKVTFHTPNALHPAFLTEEVAKYLYRAGFYRIWLGFEVADKKFQSMMGEKATLEQLEMAVANLKKAGFRGDDIGVYLMAGYPGISFSEIKKSLEFVHSLGARSSLSQFSPIPKTKAGDEFLAANLKDKPFDPLYTNNTYWWYKSPEISIVELESLRLLSRRLNS